MISKTLDRLVRTRAGDRCEYCHIPQSAFRFRFWIDHIISIQYQGVTTPGNLALACLFCNRHKGPNVAGRDPATGSVVPLYNPREHRWVDHFRLRGAKIIGTSPIGRLTVVVLAMNHPDQLLVRRALIDEGLLP